MLTRRQTLVGIVTALFTTPWSARGASSSLGANGLGGGGGRTPVVTDVTFAPSTPASDGGAVGTVSATNSPTSWSITAGDPSGDFSIDGSGNIFFTSRGETDYDGSNSVKSATLTVSATNAFGTGNGTTAINAYADGIVDAPIGSAQYSSLLDTYHSSGSSDGRDKTNGYQPPWNVAGVDYAVGPNGKPSGDPSTISMGEVSVDTSTNVISVTGDGVTLDGYDFSLDGGYRISQSGDNLTVTNFY